MDLLPTSKVPSVSVCTNSTFAKMNSSTGKDKPKLRTFVFEELPAEVRNKIYKALARDTTIWLNITAIADAGGVPTPMTTIPMLDPTHLPRDETEFAYAIAQVKNWELSSTNKLIRSECLPVLVMGANAWVYNGSDIAFDVARALPSDFRSGIENIYVSGFDPAIHVDYARLPALKTIQILQDRLDWVPESRDVILQNFAHNGTELVAHCEHFVQRTNEISQFVNTAIPPAGVRILISAMYRTRLESRFVAYGSLELPHSRYDLDVSFELLYDHRTREIVGNYLDVVEKDMLERWKVDEVAWEYKEHLTNRAYLYDQQQIEWMFKCVKNWDNRSGCIYVFKGREFIAQGVFDERPDEMGPGMKL